MNRSLAFDPFDQGIPEQEEYPKTIICPRCDGEKEYAKFTIHLATGRETEELIPCQDCNEDGRVWVDSPSDERKKREV